jgi:hypothetical protein
MPGEVTLWDAVTPANIPDDAQAVAYYMDGRYAWTPEQIARFAHVPKKRITVFGSLDADVYDIELGDGTPSKGAYWVSQKRKGGATANDTSLYTSRIGSPGYGWAACQVALRQRGLPAGCCSWWIADQTGVPHLLPGTVATQYADVGDRYDNSLALSDWLNVNDIPTPPAKENEDDMFKTNPTLDEFNACLRYVWYTLRHDVPTQADFDAYWYTWHLPIDEKGFGQSWDLVVAHVHDTAGAALR